MFRRTRRPAVDDVTAATIAALPANARHKFAALVASGSDVDAAVTYALRAR